MSWKTGFRSIYYDGAPEPADLSLPWHETALLVIDVQNTYLARPDPAGLSAEERRRYDAWTPFHRRMHDIVIPNTQTLLQRFRKNGLECLFARIATQTLDGRERSLSQKKPGWNNLLSADARCAVPIRARIGAARRRDRRHQDDGLGADRHQSSPHPA